MAAPSHSKASRAPSPLVVNLGIGLLCAIWGSTWLVIQEGLEDLPPFTAAGVRFAVAAAVMALLARPLHRAEGGARPGVGLTLVVGVLSFAASYGLVYWAETVLPSGWVSVLWATFPMFQAIGGHLALPAERLVARQWTGFVLGFAGVVLLFATDLRDFGPGAIGVAAILLASPLVSAVGNTAVKRWGGATSSVLLNRNGMAVGAVLLGALALGFETGESVRWTRAALLSVAYLSIMGTVVTFGLYFWLLRFAPAHHLSLIAYVTPAVALTLGATLHGEPLSATIVGGTLAILIGVALVVRGRPRRD